MAFELTLEKMNVKLIKADENYASALTKLMPLEIKYQLREDQILLGSGFGSQPQREADTRATIMQEPIYLEYQTAKLEAKIAYQRLDTCKVICANIRNLSFYEK
jgi:hypothetical protein